MRADLPKRAGRRHESLITGYSRSQCEKASISSVSSPSPSVSVIVPSYNRRERLARLLGGLERHRQAGAAFEVVVAVDGSTDGTLEMLSLLRTGFPLRVIAQSRSGPAAARNAAIAAARGDVLLFLDDDVAPQAGLFEHHLSFHSRHERAAAVGRMAAPPGSRLPAWLEWEATLLERQYGRMRSGLHPIDWRVFYTANASVRRDDVLAVGGFDERFLREEDVELAHRLAAVGVTFHFLPEAVVHHDPDRTFEVWLAVAFERGRKNLLLERELAPADQSLAAEWRRRHLLNRMLARWSLGHADRTRLVIAALRRALVTPSPRARRLLCSALFNVKYWAGVADASGLGAAVWRDLLDDPRTSVARSTTP
jgi:GT2 family glycosyltransferase